MVDFGGVEIIRAIVHEVPKRGVGQPPVRLSNYPSPLDEEGLALLIRNRIVAGFQRVRTEVQFDLERIGTTREDVREILFVGEETFVPATRRLPPYFIKNSLQMLLPACCS